MKNLQNNFTTPEQSRRLLELRLPADSADCVFAMYEGQVKRSILNEAMPTFSSFMQQTGATVAVYAIHKNEQYLPCWSVGRLIEIWLHICGNEGFEVYSPCYLPEVLVDAFEDYDRDTLSEYGHHIDFSKLED